MTNKNRNKLRARLIDELSSILLGPREEDEELAANPSDTYLTGVLWPKETNFSPAEDEGMENSADGGDDDAADTSTPGYRAIRPCSLGITFTVPPGTGICLTFDKTARYLWEVIVADENEGVDAAIPSDNSVDDIRDVSADEEPAEIRFHWRRKQLNYVLDIAPRTETAHWRTSTFETVNGDEIIDPLVELHIKYRVAEDGVTITATLINLASPEAIGDGDFPPDASCLFQAGIRACATDGGSLGIIPRDSVRNADDADSRSNALIYRDAKEFAVGHSVSAIWQEGADGAVAEVSTTWLPQASVKSTSFKGHESLASLRDKDFDPFAAEWLGANENRTAVVASMNEFCNIYGAWIANSVEARIGEFDGVLAQAAKDNKDRCQSAVDRMRRGVRLLADNDIAWRAFTLANQALDIQSRYKSKGDRAGALVWRPFQLAFMLLVIPSIADVDDTDRQTMDLLWFPTGGGKTEAYLGLTAFAIFHKRLTIDYRREHGGTDVLMRYTLRLLTVQQFQRAAALITACDKLRRDFSDELGTAPIDLGLYVGNDSTPNKLADAKEKLEEEVSGARPRSTPRQLLNCPVCGSELLASDYAVNLNDTSMDIVCSSNDCEWQDRPLPIHTVDETIFADPPSLLIGTVDKFAQLPRNKNLGRLFGLDSPCRPGFIIQDELHLISGPLGTITGLYESVIDLLCSIDQNRPKVIGSTATIGQAEAQVRSLFDRNVLQFPPPGIDSSDSFFAVRDDEAPDRLYVGVSSAGRSPKFALQAVLGSAMQSIYAESQTGDWDDETLDPYWTTVAYFNSLRELGGAIVMMLDDVPRTVHFVSRRQGKPSRPLELPPVELSSRISSSEIPEQLNKLNLSLGEDMWQGDPIDVVLASNMISVGVDIPRLGLMIVNGQPKSTAEYIQATSRVGRGLPGLIFTVLNFGRPRDVAHFEHFQGYHSALYRSVEATSVTPWAPRARDKALHAVLIAAIRHLSAKMRDDDAAREFELDDSMVDEVVTYLYERSKSSSNGTEHAGTREDLNRIVQRWARRAAEQRSTGGKLRYWERSAPFGKVAPHLMRDAEKAKRSDTPAWATPNSMREIEPSTAFVLKEFYTAPAEGEEEQ